MKVLKSIRGIAEAVLDGKEVEFKCPDTGEWISIKNLLIPINCIDDETNDIFRVKTTKPSIDWAHVSDELNYLAVDKDGTGFLFKCKPSIDGEGHWVDDSSFVFANVKWFSSFKAGNCDWWDSLVERPKDI